MFSKPIPKSTSENSRNRSQNEKITSIIGEDLRIEGNLNSQTTIRIDGQVSGDVEAANLIIIGEKALLKGNLKSNAVLVHGQVTGDVQCGELVITKSGSITGEMNVGSIEIEMGGRYNGTLTMGNQEKIIALGKEKRQA